MLETEHYIDLAAGRFASTSAKDLESIFAKFVASPCATLVVHFHGGLNRTTEGIARVSQLAPIYLDAGAYPVFFVWESWVAEVAFNGVAEIFSETIFQGAVSRIRDFLLDKIRSSQVYRGVADESAEDLAARRALEAFVADPAAAVSIPPARRSQLFILTERERRDFRDAVQNDALLRDEIGAIANAQRGGADAERRERGGTAAHGLRQTRMNPEFLETVRDPGQAYRAAFALKLASALLDILVRVCKRLANGHDHGLQATIVEEVLRALYLVEGWFSWMKSQIEDAFKPDPAQYGGTAFLSGLQLLRQAGGRPRVVLVGHSAGSIYICNFLEHAKRMVPGQLFDVVFLTPAVSFERFAETLAGSADVIANLKSIALTDALEREDRWLPVLPDAYPASLLYFTSGVMEPDVSGNGDVAIVGMQRFFSDAGAPGSPACERVRAYFAAKPERLAWSVLDLRGAEGPREVEVGRHHGGFDEDAGTRAVLQSIIRDGF